MMASMIRHPLIWFWLLAPKRAEAALWSVAKFMWTLVALFIGFLVLVGVAAGAGMPAVGRAVSVPVVATVTTTAVAPVKTSVVRKVVARKPLSSATSCPGCSDEVLRTLK